jgi:hypothetical protein
MIHPDTELRDISEEIGYGVFATKLIPKGTITYVRDTLEIYISSSDFKNHPEAVQKIIEKFSFIDEEGNRIVSWDLAKYVNHSCNRNSISTGYGFEMAIRDIQPGEQITDEYGIFNVPYEMSCSCGEANCRKKIVRSDFDTHHKEWDELILEAFKAFQKINQPLYQFIDENTQSDIVGFLENSAKYISVF